MPNPPLLIESWLPIEAIGAESLRDASAAQKPPLNRLHVWWARRPLTTSRAAILASVLPRWSADFPAGLRERFPDEKAYRAWFLRFIGILGDPVAGKKLIQMAKERNLQLKSNPYGYARAFTVNPSADDLQTMGDLLEWTWGQRDLRVLDPFSGGGSIPFEALRYGFTTFANDLNPVAATILKATLDYPARFGPSLAEDIRKWGNEWAKHVKVKLDPYFPKQPGENIFAYLWARTVACPTTGKPVPLSPNWWLATGDKPVAVRLVAEVHMDAPLFEIVIGAQAKSSQPDIGTIANGNGRSPWTGETINGDYIKAEAQAGRMGSVLYAVIKKRPNGLDYQTPSGDDVSAVQRVCSELEKRRGKWDIDNVLPTEEIGVSNYDRGHRLYGVQRWSEFFSERQLFSLGIYLETLREVCQSIDLQYDVEKAKAVKTFLAIAFDKAAIYNTQSCRFDQGRGIRSIFDKHNFAFVWSHAEFDASSNLLPWTIDQTEDAFKGLVELTTARQYFRVGKSSQTPVTIAQGSAASLPHIPTASIHNITVDPPYYDNVQYAELSDFFYVWLKRSVGHLFPEFFQDELTNKDDEAVANPARFEGMGKKKKELAEQDYERKMGAAFKEMHRVLHPKGSLTVMFTHKRVEAWDTLASALIGAGFVIKASWPVHTESEHSLHQAKKNAASSTILLACRKRDDGRQIGNESLSTVHRPLSGAAVWWDDIKEQVRATARQKAAEFSRQGIHGVDLYLSTFGPTLSILSEHWPVLTSEIDPKTGQPRPLRPEVALDLAREEVIRLRKQGLLAGHEVTFDPVTDWYLMAWDAFGAEQFPYDEARKLAIALGIDLDKELMQHKRIAAKKGEYVVLQTPAERRKKGMVDDDLASFPCWIDAVHTAMMVYAEDGSGACDAFLQKSTLKHDSTFKACLQALLNAVPRSRIKGKFVRPEADVLENMRLAFYDDLSAPAEEEPEMLVERQLGLWEEKKYNSEIENDSDNGHPGV